jgi:hypothetical protein
MPHDAIRGNRGRHAVGVMDALSAREQEREGDRFGDVAGGGGPELLIGVGMTQYGTEREQAQSDLSVQRLRALKSTVVVNGPCVTYTAGGATLTLMGGGGGIATVADESFLPDMPSLRLGLEAPRAVGRESLRAGPEHAIRVWDRMRAATNSEVLNWFHTAPGWGGL